MNSRTVPRRNSRARRLVLAAVSALALAWAAPAYPQMVVTCPTCSQSTQQILQYARQLLQLEQEIQIVQYAITNTLNFPNLVFSDITSDVNRLTSLSSGASLIAGNTNSFLLNLANTGGYPLATAQNWQQQIIFEQNAVANAIRTYGNMLGLQPQQLANYSTQLAALQAQAQSAAGRLQVQQAIAGIQAATGQQLNTTQAQMSAALQAQLAVSTSQADRQGLQDALWQQFSNFTPMPVGGSQGFGAP